MAYDLNYFQQLLRVNKHKLDDDLEIHADHQERISRGVTTATAAMAQAKERLQQVEGRLRLEFKDENAKATVAEIDAKVGRDRSRVQAWEECQDALRVLADWQGMLEAWKQKGYAMRELGSLYSSQYFSLNSAGGSRRQQQREEGAADYQRGREAMNEKRRGRVAL